MQKAYIKSIYLSIFLCMILATYGIAIKAKLKDGAILTNSTPVTNKIVILDAGHGLPDERCIIFFTEQQSRK